MNPRRSILSSFTLVSLLGVLLGVAVLVIVMAIYAGMERTVKERVLGFTPHVLLQKQEPIDDWQAMATELRKFPGVEAVTPYIADNVVIDVNDLQRPVAFRAIDSRDPQQVGAIRNMLDLKAHPQSSADMGLDDRVVISSQLSDQFKVPDGGGLRSLGVGDKILLYSTRNFKEVMRTYKSTEKPVLRIAYKDQWDKVKSIIGETWESKDGRFTLANERFNEVFTALQELNAEPIRQPEHDRVEAILAELDQSENEEAEKRSVFDEKSRQKIRELVAEIDVADGDKMDGEILKSMKQIVLPKEATVIGIYQTSQQALTPDVFVPLPLAQDLSGLDDMVSGISVRIKDPYAAAQAANAIAQHLTADWMAITWMDQYQSFFSLIKQQRVMMYFALSFIVLVAAFSMMAVMFTVTILKRREIGVMKALGASSGQIVRVFLYQGMLLGAVGALLGWVGGRAVIHFRGGIQEFMRTLRFDPFSTSFTGFDVLPAHNDAGEQWAICVAAFLLCALAAMIPAFFAARNDAAKSLRNL